MYFSVLVRELLFLPEMKRILKIYKVRTGLNQSNILTKNYVRIFKNDFLRMHNSDNCVLISKQFAKIKSELFVIHFDFCISI